MKIIYSLLITLLSVCLCTSGAYAQSKPYQGMAQTIPGRVQMEFYDEGGQGVAYNDADSDNNGSGKLNKDQTFLARFRQSDGVDISYTKKDLDKTVDGPPEHLGDLYLGWTAPGEWVKYTVDVQAGGMYRVKAHLSSRTDVAQISLALDGTDKTGAITLPTTGHWHTWRIVDKLTEFNLDKGRHVLTLSVLKEGNFNLDYLEFIPEFNDGSLPPAFSTVDAFDQVKKMGRGLNIIGYDPLWKNFEKARFQARHFQRIREAGFQTVRINLESFPHMDASNQLDPVWLRTLDWAVNNATADHLMVIIDEHDYTFCGENAAACKPKLMAFWQQVADHYKDAPSNVVFEILNEPNTQLTADLWNSYMREALAIIRATNPTRTVVIGPASWNGISFLDKLELPEDDRNIIATVHYYLPMKFTHQGASWSKSTAMLSGITWGTDEEKQAVVRDLTKAQNWSKEHKRPILLGEFGAYDKGDIDSRVRYTSWVARTAESFGWAWTYWQFDSNFIAYDIDKDAWVEPILKALVP